MEHRKLEHFQKEMDGFCRFSDDKCWYAHTYSFQSKQIKNLNKDPDLIKRLFTMMEKFTKRIENIENQL